MHFLSEHVRNMIHQHGTLLKFSNESVESSNNTATKLFLNRSNHKEGALTQVLKCATRAAILKDENTPVLKRQKCSVCHNLGHKKNKCIMQGRDETPSNENAPESVPRIHRSLNAQFAQSLI